MAALQLIILIVIFLLVMIFLLKAFSGAISTSKESSRLQNSVDICRNAAEIFAATDSIEDIHNMLDAEHLSEDEAIYYNNDWQICSADKASYILKINTATQDSAAGKLISANIALSNVDDEIIYELNTEKYVGEADE